MTTYAPLIIMAVLVVVALMVFGRKEREPAPMPIVMLVGDSLTMQTPDTFAAMTGFRYDTRLRAHGGVCAHQILTGEGAVPSDWPWKPFAELVAEERPNIIVLRLGGADAVLGTDGEAFKADLTEITNCAKASGARVYLVGVIQSPMFEVASERTDSINREVSRSEGVPYISLRSLPFDAAADLGDDGLHPSQGYSDRCVAQIVSAL